MTTVDGHDTIVRDGHEVHPSEVEAVLMSHPGISLAAVVGVPDEFHGEEVKAFVVRKPGARVTGDELIWWSKRVMAASGYPRMVEFRESLPMTATGEVRRHELGYDGD